MRIGYHASHEQHSPRRLLENVRAAEDAGFDGAMCSDHFHPWLTTQGHSGYTWSWLGAALEGTGLSFGTVTAPGWRYHPAIVAQAAATLESMYPERLWLALGSGEALNESITGEPWPASRAERNARLAESADVIRRLWNGETVSHRGRIVVEEAKLYTRPDIAPLLFGAALGEDTAAFVGGWADGLITVGGPRESIAPVIDAFRSGGGAGKPVYVQHVLSWAPSMADATRQAREQWAFSALGGDVLPMLRTPAEFEAAARSVTADELAARIRISPDPARHAAWIAEYEALGVEAVMLHDVGLNQAAFIDTFAANVLPALRASG
jgi:probable non-F420 flavinoid oxidoreductase